MRKIKFLLLLMIAGVAVVMAKPELREQVLDALFGAEEEFTYSGSEA